MLNAGQMTLALQVDREGRFLCAWYGLSIAL